MRIMQDLWSTLRLARGEATPPLYRRIGRVQEWMKVAETLTTLLLLEAEVRAQSAYDGFDPVPNGLVSALAVQPDGKVLIGGDFTTLFEGHTGTTTRNHIGRLNSNGTLDASFDPGANNTVRALAVQADGKILIGGDFTTLGGGGTGTTTRNHIGRLNPDGTLDASFDPGVNGSVYVLALQADGKILVTGFFTTLGGGGTGTTTRNHIGRLNSNGTLDTSFNPGANSTVGALAVQADGKILVGGDFTTLGGGGIGTTTRNHIGRLNPDGTLDASFDPGANSYVAALAVQADGKILVGGTFTTLGGGGTGTTTQNYIGRLNPNGTLDPSLNPGPNSFVNALAVQADGKILIGGAFTDLAAGGLCCSGANHIGRLNPDGTLDTSFISSGANGSIIALAVQSDSKILVCAALGGVGGGIDYIGRLSADGRRDASFNPGANNTVYTLAVQADGKILIGGAFTIVGGAPDGNTMTRNYIARFNPDGTLDASFDPGANNIVYALAVQADGKILVAGFFTTFGGGGTGTTARNRIARLNADGTLDTSFDPGANDFVDALAVQANGKILVGGNFTTLGGGGTTACTYIGRLNPNGTLDISFNPGANDRVFTLAVQADGKILVGGNFTTLGDGGFGTTPRNHIGRFNPDGTLDASFDPGANGPVYALAVQGNGKILAGGNFTTLGGGGTGTTTRNYIGRLNPDGTLDTSFNPGANGPVYALAVQADGKVLLGASFTTLGGGGTGTTTRNRIGRLNPDGTLDTSFDAGANNAVNAVAMQADGKILVGGLFVTIGGSTETPSRNRIGRLTNTDAAIQELTLDTNGTTIIWRRSGASPEISRVTFELSSDAINYSALANPSRVTAGWQLTGQSLPTHQNIFIRARGFYSTGVFNGSGSIVETVRSAFISPPPVPTSIISQKTHGAGSFGIPVPLTGNLGIECRTGGAPGNHTIVATFSVPVTFNWAAVTSGTGSVMNATGSGTTVVTVNLTGVANAQTIIVTLFGLNDGTNTGKLGIPMGVLLGDVNGSGRVDGNDVSAVQNHTRQPLNSGNFQYDVNVNGVIDGNDVSTTQGQTRTSLP